MKRCDKCGFVDWTPDKKCPECGDKYDKQSSQCNPLSGHVDDMGIHNRFSAAEVSLGNYHFKSKKIIE